MNIARKLATLITGVAIGVSLTAWFYEERIAQVLELFEKAGVSSWTDEQRRLQQEAEQKQLWWKIESDLKLLAVARDASNPESLAAINDALYRLKSNQQTLDIIVRNSEIVIEGDQEWFVEYTGAKFDR